METTVIEKKTSKRLEAAIRRAAAEQMRIHEHIRHGKSLSELTSIKFVTINDIQPASD